MLWQKQCGKKFGNCYIKCVHKAPVSGAGQVKQLAAGSLKNNASPVFRLYVKGAAVTVRFSEEESEDVKCRVRDILTRAYGECFFRLYGCISIRGRALAC